MLPEKKCYQTGTYLPSHISYLDIFSHEHKTENTESANRT
jgi:hypothetical protein